jgi:hypothetical protein
MPIDSEGIYQYDDSEDFSPLFEYLNLLANSTSATAAAIRAELAALDNLVDSNWVNITTFGTGWAPVLNYTPRVRKIGNRVDIAGMVSVTSLSATLDDVLTFPVGFRPIGAHPNQWVGPFHSSGGMWGMYQTVSTAGATQYKLTAPGSYRTGPSAVGDRFPLSGGFWVD